MTVIFSDTFTDTNGTNITSHTPDTDTPGSGWQYIGQIGNTPAGTEVTIQGNRWECSADHTGCGTDTGEVDVTISGDWDTTNTGDRNSIQFRWFSNVSSWRFNIRRGNSDIRLIKYATGDTVMDSSAYSYTTKTYPVQVVISGNNIDCYLDGVLELSASGDSYNSTRTIQGITRDAGGTSSHWDNFEIDDGATGGGSEGAFHHYMANQ